MNHPLRELEIGALALGDQLSERLVAILHNLRKAIPERPDFALDLVEAGLRDARTTGRQQSALKNHRPNGWGKDKGRTEEQQR